MHLVEYFVAWRHRMEVRFYRFGAHFLSFVPSIVVCGMAYMMNVDWKLLQGFTAFAIATVSLEVCITCLREKYRNVHLIGRHPERNLPERLSAMNRLLDEVILDRTRCWVAVMLVLSLWAMVAACELVRLQSKHLPEDREVWAFYFSGVNFGIAVIKMWLGSNEFSLEDVLSRPSGSHRVPNPHTVDD